MYVIVVYDILMNEEDAGECGKIYRRVFKICKQYMNHIQKSVFEGELSPPQYVKLKVELAKHIRKDKDSLVIFHSRDQRWLEKDFLGVEDEKFSNFF